MTKSYALEYWRDGDWYVGRVPEIPGVFSQGATLEELVDNVKDAYRLMVEDAKQEISFETQQTMVELDV